MREIRVGYYVDADLLGLAHVLASIRPDVTYPGDLGGVVRKRLRPPCPITTTDVDDDVWIPELARRGWIILTKDRHIRDRPAEAAAVIENAAKVFAITTSREQLTVWGQLEVVMCRWRDIERLGEPPGPFIYGMTRSSIRPLL